MNSRIRITQYYTCGHSYEWIKTIKDAYCPIEFDDLSSQEGGYHCYDCDSRINKLGETSLASVVHLEKVVLERMTRRKGKRVSSTKDDAIPS